MITREKLEVSRLSSTDGTDQKQTVERNCNIYLQNLRGSVREGSCKGMKENDAATMILI